jgi:hypothetical protein
MQRFDINNSDYAALFHSKGDGPKILQSILDDSRLFGIDYGWALTQGRVANAPTPTNADGAAVFQVESRKLEAAPLMDLRAPLGDSHQMDNEGMEFYTASIPDFIARGWVETATQRAYKEKMFAQFGNDATLIAQWVRDVASVGINSAKSTLNNMTAQLETTGKIDYTGLGAGIYTPLHKANIPTDNFIKAGEKVWTDSDCKILTQMRKIEDAYRDSRGGYQGSLVWKMTKKMYQDTFLQNQEVRDLYVTWCKANYIAYVEGMPITNEQFLKSIADIQGISPIEIVTEKERNKTVSTDTYVKGWADNIVVLRPAGDAVEFQYTNVLDQELATKFGAKAIDVVFGQYLEGLVTVCNTTTDNGRFQEWHTDVMMSACPALLSFTNHVIINTAQAD